MREWLIKIRTKQKKSQYKVAANAGISQSYYASIETGVRGNKLPVMTAKKIACVLNFDWTLFFEDITESQKRKGHHNERTTII